MHAYTALNLSFSGIPDLVYRHVVGLLGKGQNRQKMSRYSSVSGLGVSKPRFQPSSSRRHQTTQMVRALFSTPVCASLFIEILYALPMQCVHLFRSSHAFCSSCRRKQYLSVGFCNRDLVCFLRGTK